MTLGAPRTTWSRHCRNCPARRLEGGCHTADRSGAPSDVRSVPMGRLALLSLDAELLDRRRSTRWRGSRKAERLRGQRPQTPDPDNAGEGNPSRGPMSVRTCCGPSQPVGISPNPEPRSALDRPNSFNRGVLRSTTRAVWGRWRGTRLPGVSEILAARDGGVDLPELAQHLQFELKDLLPTVDGAALLAPPGSGGDDATMALSFLFAMCRSDEHKRCNRRLLALSRYGIGTQVNRSSHTPSFKCALRPTHKNETARPFRGIVLSVRRQSREHGCLARRYGRPVRQYQAGLIRRCVPPPNLCAHTTS